MTQVIINSSRPQSRKILTTQLYGEGTTGALIKDFGGTDITGGGWVTGLSVLGAGAGTIVTLHDGTSASDMVLLDVQPRTVVNMNIELPASNWRKFDDGVYLVAVLAASTRLFIHYYQGE